MAHEALAADAPEPLLPRLGRSLPHKELSRKFPRDAADAPELLLPRLEHNRPHKEHSREPPRDAASHSAADVVRAGVEGERPLAEPP